jgi:hypothetical protein
MANDILNHSIDLKQKVAPIDKFARSKVRFNPKNWSTFGAPVYVLDNTLHASKGLNKWKMQARVGIYLG